MCCKVSSAVISGADNSWRSQSEKTTLLSPSICDKCGECESCEKRKRRVYHKKQGTGKPCCIQHWLGLVLSLGAAGGYLRLVFSDKIGRS